MYVHVCLFPLAQKDRCVGAEAPWYDDDMAATSLGDRTFQLHPSPWSMWCMEHISENMDFFATLSGIP